MQRVAVVDETSGELVAFNEGDYKGGGRFVFEIPYFTLLPKRAELINVLAPNVPSATHVAFNALRVESTLWQMGQAAGCAAALAKGHAVQDVDVVEIQDTLMSQHVFVHWPSRRRCRPSKQTL